MRYAIHESINLQIIINHSCQLRQGIKAHGGDPPQARSTRHTAQEGRRRPKLVTQVAL